jgi:hypothetical protein
VQIYAGPATGSLTEAATGVGGAAEQLEQHAGNYGDILSALREAWHPRRSRHVNTPVMTVGRRRHD